MCGNEIDFLRETRQCYTYVVVVKYMLEKKGEKPVEEIKCRRTHTHTRARMFS